jgi:hypothetical protein
MQYTQIIRTIQFHIYHKDRSFCFYIKITNKLELRAAFLQNLLVIILMFLWQSENPVSEFERNVCLAVTKLVILVKIYLSNKTKTALHSVT